ncbi:unnamed protein product, partial [Mesorhabditis belari]|uniref:DNA-directed RNA polymerase III subunit RPC9 n=1 Tax=Mesorhabditis belari TaxID=2138241 RepID=A0AAF3FJ84_9BILA
MEVINKMVTILPNMQVLKVVEETKALRGKRPADEESENLNTLLHETAAYFKDTPASAQKDEHVIKLNQELQPYKLTIAETVQILNLRPSTAVEVQLVVEECEERIRTEEELEALVKKAVDESTRRRSWTNENLGFADSKVLTEGRREELFDDMNQNEEESRCFGSQKFVSTIHQCFNASEKQDIPEQALT